MKIALILLLIIINIIALLIAIKKIKKEFYSDIFLLAPLGIYIWGDALILAPFWIISGIIFFFIPVISILKYIIIFYTARSFYEVIYWLNHQAVKDSYNPPFFRKIKSIGSNESAILYQLIHTCIVIVGIFILFS